MSITNYPPKYLTYNAEMSKTLSIVMSIEGVDTLFGINDTYTAIKYGDPGIKFGLPGLKYGGLRLVGGLNGVAAVKPYIVLDNSMIISQRIEPEQGRGSVGTLTITLIDKNGEVSEIIAPGITVNEIMLQKEVKIYLGFQQTSFPGDYVLLFRGYITQLMCPAGLVKFQLSDATTKKRQPIFDTTTSNTSNALNAIQTNIAMLSTANFFQQIQGPAGTYDPIVRTYIQIDDEFMEYDHTGIASPTLINVLSRGGSHGLGTVPSTHDIDATVSAGIQLGGNVAGVNCITLALKVMLSGWAGPCDEEIVVRSFVITADPTLGLISTAFCLKTTDAKLDLGLTVGDYFSITGASNSGNNISGKITAIGNAVQNNVVIYTDQTFILENPTSALAAFRSKYDTLPVECGVKLRMRDVDVETWEYIRDHYFTSATSSNVQFFFNSPSDGKTLIDTQILLPFGLYSISRYGRLSVAITRPPLPGASKMITLDWTNVLDPDKIQVTRATNNRCFFNLITFQFDKDPSTGNYGTLYEVLDTDSLNRFDQVSKLPITADGLTTALGGKTIAQVRGKSLLTRYKKIALMLDIQVNWTVGSLIEVCDIVLLKDNGQLKIMNFETGKRDLGVQLFEVIDRTYDITGGRVKLKLLGGLEFNVDSRFALNAPSSKLDSGSTTTVLKIKPSYGQTSIVTERGKWEQVSGQQIQLHNSTWSSVQKTTITGFSNSDFSLITVSPPLSSPPPADYIIDIDSYPTSTDKAEAQILKTLYTHLSPSVKVVSGISTTQFVVSSGDAARMTVGNFVFLRNNDWSVQTDEIKVLAITGTTITLKTALSFTPNSSYTVEGVGYHDGTGCYRYN